MTLLQTMIQLCSSPTTKVFVDVSYIKNQIAKRFNETPSIISNGRMTYMVDAKVALIKELQSVAKELLIRINELRQDDLLQLYNLKAIHENFEKISLELVASYNITDKNIFSEINIHPIYKNPNDLSILLDELEDNEDTAFAQYMLFWQTDLNVFIQDVISKNSNAAVARLNLRLSREMPNDREIIQTWRQALEVEVNFLDSSHVPSQGEKLFLLAVFHYHQDQDWIKGDNYAKEAKEAGCDFTCVKLRGEYVKVQNMEFFAKASYSKNNFNYNELEIKQCNDAEKLFLLAENALLITPIDIYLDLYYRAAENGHALACYRLAKLLKQGIVSIREYYREHMCDESTRQLTIKEIDWYRIGDNYLFLAISRGMHFAIYDRVCNLNNALPYITLAAEAGDYRAAETLAFGTYNQTPEVSWIKKGADSGSILLMHKLAQEYVEGKNDRKKDLYQALTYFQKATAKGLDNINSSSVVTILVSAFKDNHLQLVFESYHILKKILKSPHYSDFRGILDSITNWYKNNKNPITLYYSTILLSYMPVYVYPPTSSTYTEFNLLVKSADKNPKIRQTLLNLLVNDNWIDIRCVLDKDLIEPMFQLYSTALAMRRAYIDDEYPSVIADIIIDYADQYNDYRNKDKIDKSLLSTYKKIDEALHLKENAKHISGTFPLLKTQPLYNQLNAIELFKTKKDSRIYRVCHLAEKYKDYMANKETYLRLANKVSAYKDNFLSKLFSKNSESAKIDKILKPTQNHR